jgi:fucose permease
LNFGIGLCQGAMEVVINLEIIHMERKGQSRLMNLAHAVFCVGAIGGPAAVGYLLNARVPVVAIFVISSSLFAVLALFSVLTRFPRVRQAPEPGARSGLRLLRQPLLLLITAVLLIYVGTEIGISSWASEYVVKVLGVPASTAAFAVALFWTGLLAGRLSISFGYRGTRQELVMLGLSVLSAAALVVVLLVRSPAAVAAAIFVAGLGSSGFYPLGMSLLGKHFKSGVAVGTAATGGAAGAIAFPFLMALLSQGMGVRSGFRLYLVLNGILIVLTVVLVRVVRRSAKPLPEVHE